MANVDDFNAKVDVITAVPEEQTRTPNMPVDVFAQEAENLHNWIEFHNLYICCWGQSWHLPLADTLPRSSFLPP